MAGVEDMFVSVLSCHRCSELDAAAVTVLP